MGAEVAEGEQVMKDEGFAGLPEHLQPSNLPHRSEQVTFENLKACAAAHRELLEENRTLQATLSATAQRVEALEKELECLKSSQ
jgi:dynactin complex subunit